MSNNNVVSLVTFIASAMERGHNLIEEPSTQGGLLVDDDVIALAADMEMVAIDHYEGDFKRFNADFLIEVSRARDNGDDPLEEIRLWLDGFLNKEARAS